MCFEIHRQGALEYSCAKGLSGVTHCFTTRLGGVSQGVLSSLNLGIHRGDEPENVLENYRILGNALDFSPENLVFTHQTHTAIVRRVGREDRGQGLFRPVPGDYDGLITNEPEVALIVFSADCTPVLLYDPVKKAVGAVHAGWRGTAAGIAARAVEAMKEAYGCRPEDLRAAIGPCIGPCCFQTRADVPEAMLAALGEAAEAAIRPAGDRYYVNLKELNALWLRRCGLSQIDISPECTHCHPERYWSHRITGEARGSQAAIIQLPPERE